MALLEIENLSVAFPSPTATGRAVDGVSIAVAESESVGVVGESGSGKSLTMLAVMGLVPYPGQVTADRIRFKGRDLLQLSRRERRALAGKSMAMIFQDPMTSLNPCFTIGFQLVETLRTHERVDRKAARRRAIALLEQVGIPTAESRMGAFPHQLSGGMNQRVMIAMAIACRPALLIADEPTTALDVTVQAQILALLRSLQRDHGMALVLVSHNMDVVAETARRVVVMYAGQIVEERDTAGLFAAPQHPYTAALLAARPGHTASGRLATIAGVPPGLNDRPRGCLFGPRCAYATARTSAARPEIRPWMEGRVRCHYPLGDPDRNVRIAADGPVGAKLCS
jgi:dipeptide transport system ATP-binding protein